MYISHNDATLDMRWMMQPTPDGNWFHLNADAGSLTLEARLYILNTREQPAFLGRRQQHTAYTASTTLAPPQTPGYSAALAVFQSEQFHCYLGVTHVVSGYQVFAEQAKGGEPKIIREHLFDELPTTPLTLGVEQNAGAISFY